MCVYIYIYIITVCDMCSSYGLKGAGGSSYWKVLQQPKQPLTGHWPV